MTAYYPVFMDINDKACLVVGGGGVGTRKALGLLNAGARVRVVSKQVSAELEAEALENPRLILEKRGFDPKDLGGATLVFAATDSQEINARVRRAAQEARVLCNAADGPDKGDFIVPALVERQDLRIAVSTCGASPALARKIRKMLQETFGPEYGELVRVLAGVRQQLLAQGHDPEGHRALLTALVNEDLIPLIAAGDRPELDRILNRVLGEGFSWDTLSK